MNITKSVTGDSKEMYAANLTSWQEDQVAALNIRYLASYIDIYKTLIQDREDFINSYVAGVRSKLAPAIADKWDPSALSVAAFEPSWVSELQAEIQRLEQSGKNVNEVHTA